MLTKPLRSVMLPLIVLLLVVCQYNSVLAQQSKQPEISRDSLLTIARSIIDSTTYCILATIDTTGSPRLRPMEPFSPDSNMTIWLGTNRYSRKVQEIKKNPSVTLNYFSPDYMGYVSVNGTAELVDDAAAKEKWWKPKWSVFFKDKDDVYLLIKVTPVRIEFVDYVVGINGNSKTGDPVVIDF